MRGALILALLWAAPSFAQDFVPKVDPAQTDQCFADTESGITAPDCVGAAASTCMEQVGGFSTQGMSACVDAETALWDGFLNTQYKARMAALTKSQKAALQSAQRAWIAYRDADCGLQYEMFSDGTIRSNIYAGCMLNYTSARALMLRDLGSY